MRAPEPAVKRGAPRDGERWKGTGGARGRWSGEGQGIEGVSYVASKGEGIDAGRHRGQQHPVLLLAKRQCGRQLRAWVECDLLQRLLQRFWRVRYPALHRCWLRLLHRHVPAM